MFSLPNQTLESFDKSLDYVISKNPEHISVYSLKIEENTPLYSIKDTLNLPDEDTDIEMYHHCVTKLTAAGYPQYEISNFQKEGINHLTT
jgi:oxygen-independent coproporphyrinogen-3 oxidase